MFILDLFGYSGHIIGFLLFFGCFWCDLRLRNPPPVLPLWDFVWSFTFRNCVKNKKVWNWMLYIYYNGDFLLSEAVVFHSVSNCSRSLRNNIGSKQKDRVAGLNSYWCIFQHITLHCTASCCSCEDLTALALMRTTTFACLAVCVWHGRWNLLREEQNQVNSWLGSSWHDTNLTIIT